LAKRGAVVGLLGRRREKAEELAVILREKGFRCPPTLASLDKSRLP
jgi:short-subunit dehydrogenase